MCNLVFAYKAALLIFEILFKQRLLEKEMGGEADRGRDKGRHGQKERETWRQRDRGRQGGDMEGQTGSDREGQGLREKETGGEQ